MTTKLNRMPALMDMAQSVSGLILVLFMWAHMLFVSSILISKDAMYWVSKMFEGEPVFGKSYPVLVSMVAVFIFAMILVHAFLAMRKFPSSDGEHRAIYRHLTRFKHRDTQLWYVQFVTGFALFFLASIHLYQLMVHPADIGPYASSDRVWSDVMWPLYLVLLFVVEIHGGIGAYRLVIKWGLFPGKNTKQTIRRLQKIKWLVTLFFLVLGLCTLAAYMKIGAEHADQAGERYIPTYLSREAIHGAGHE